MEQTKDAMRVSIYGTLVQQIACISCCSCSSQAGMGNEQLMSMGRSQINETDASLLRSERIVHDTIAVGAQTAETLQAQGEQLEKVRRKWGGRCAQGQMLFLVRLSGSGGHRIMRSISSTGGPLIFDVFTRLYLFQIMDDLDEIEFTMKKAQQVMKDMVRGITTDKCLMVLLLLVVCAIIAVIVVRVLKSKGKIVRRDQEGGWACCMPNKALGSSN